MANQYASLLFIYCINQTSNNWETGREKIKDELVSSSRMTDLFCWPFDKMLELRMHFLNGSGKSEDKKK